MSAPRTPTPERDDRWLYFRDAHDLPPADYVIPGMRAGTVGMLVGPGGMGKSMLALAIAAGVALGSPIGQGNDEPLFPAPKRGTAAIAFGEDPAEIIRERQEAFVRGLSPQQVAALDADEGLRVMSMIARDMRIIDTSVRPFAAGPWQAELREIAQGRRLVILDSLAFLHDADENDNPAMTLLMRTLSGIAHDTHCALLVLHHSAKASSDGRDDAARARGASALTNGVRVQYDLRGPTKDEAAALGIDESRRWWWCRFATVKVNYCEPLEPAWLTRSGPGGLLQRVGLPTPGETRTQRKGARRSTAQTNATSSSGGYWEDA